MIDRDKMKVLGFPKVHKRLQLSEYANHLRELGIDEADAADVERALEGGSVKVWLNHNQAFKDRWLDWNTLVETGQKLQVEIKTAAMQKEVDRDLIATLTEQLNAHTANTMALGREVEAMLLSCEPEDVQAIADHSPELYRWVTSTAWEFVKEYRSGRKKGAAR